MNNLTMQEQDWQEPLLFDWAGINGPPLTEEDLFNCEMARMLRNEFHPPFYRPEYVRQKPWWNPRDPNPGSTDYIPGKQKIPKYPRLSTLTQRQHRIGLRMLSCQFSVAPYNFPSPEQDDFDSFEKFKDIYEKELKEYRLWARKRWVEGDCVRTLHLKPLLETVYKAQFELKKYELHTLPHEFIMAAQIIIEPREDAFEFQPIKDLKSVDIKNLPVISCPDNWLEDVSIMEQYDVPVPCSQHPTRFILPDEDTVTTLTLPEVNKQLAHFAMENGATFIASEKALQCLLESEQDWKLPMYVEEVECPESGDLKTVVVLGSRFSLQKEFGAQRSYEAFRHLLWKRFTTPDTAATSSPAHQAGPSNPNPSEQLDCREATPSSGSGNEKLKTAVIEGRRSSAPVSCVPCMPGLEPCRTDQDNKSNNSVEDQQMDVIEQRRQSTESPHVLTEATDSSRNENYKIQTELKRKQQFSLIFGSDSEEERDSEESFHAEAEIGVEVPDEERNRIRDAGMSTDKEAQSSNQISFDTTTLPTKGSPDIIGENQTPRAGTDDNDCSCKGTTFEVPPPRSFKTWQVKDAASDQSYNMIVHSSHKAQDRDMEAILEPIVEWQPELGACKQSAGRLRAQALALMMRPKARLLRVRVDYNNGNIIVIDNLTEEKFTEWHGDKRSEIASRIYAAIAQLRLLKPGQYILAHNSGQGANVMVYSALTGPAGAGAHTMSLRPDNDNLSDAQEADLSKSVCLELSRAMLPNHKHHKILPLAFTWDKNHVMGYQKATPASPAHSAKAKPQSAAKKRRRIAKKRKSKKRRTKQPAN